VTTESSLPPTVAGTVVTVGTFDGVHRGHQDVLARLVSKAERASLPSVVVTFDIHPLEVVRPEAAPQLLTVADEKIEVIAESGIDYLAMLRFTSELAAYPAERFVDEILRDRVRVQSLLIGHDHGFGRGRAGDVEVLKQLGANRGFEVEVVPAVSLGGGSAVSSTAIRRAGADGDLAAAWDGLGRPYSLSSRVVHGEKRGRLLGYPTVNLAPPSARKLLPPAGVYAVRVATPSGEFGGMMNLGPRPTFDDPAFSLEAHVFDASGDWYDARVRVEFVARLRETRRFDGAAALVEQLHRDADAARRALTAFAGPRNLPSFPRSTSPST
jgi:riboflavin kinase/FMN adenylyltransferase